MRSSAGLAGALEQVRLRVPQNASRGMRRRTCFRFLLCRAFYPKTGIHFSGTRSSFLFCRAFCPKTGTHFSGTR